MKKIISLLIPLLPILSIYKSPIPRVDLGTFCTIIILIFLLVYLKNNSKKLLIFKRSQSLNYLLLYCLYIVIIFLFSLLSSVINVSVLTICFRIIKFILFVIFAVICINNELFDYNYSLFIYKKIIIASSILVIFQTILYYGFSKNIYGVFMPLILQGDYQYVDYDVMRLQYLYRPCAFFLEPSSMTGYFSLFLAILLNKKPDRNNIIFAIFITMCMILSTSGQAYLYGTILWLIFLLKILRKYFTKKTIMILFIIILILPAIIPKIYNTNLVYKSIQRIIDGSESGGNAVLGRTSSIEYYNNLPVINKLFGVGYGNPLQKVYFNSITYTLYCTGAIGFMIITVFFLKSLKIYDKRNALFYWFLSMLFSTTFTATNIGFYLPYLSVNDERMESNE